MEKLSKKQEDVLDALKKFMAKNSYPPTVRELANMLNLNSTATVFFHLNKLEEKGYIKRKDNANRAIEILVDNEYLDDNKLIKVPLLGNIHAGNLSEAIADSSEFIEIPSNIVGKNNEVYSLEVVGNSMIDAGIFDGDIVLVNSKANTNNGDIVIFSDLDNNVTIKRFYKEKGRIRLHPENKELDDIYLDNGYILGKVIGLYRNI